MAAAVIRSSASGITGDQSRLLTAGPWCKVRHAPSAANRSIVGTSLSASSIAGWLMLYHCRSRWLQHARRWIGWMTILGAALGIVRLNQINQCFPRHSIFLLDQKSEVTPAWCASWQWPALNDARESCLRSITRSISAITRVFRMGGSGFLEPP